MRKVGVRSNDTSSRVAPQVISCPSKATGAVFLCSEQGLLLERGDRRLRNSVLVWIVWIIQTIWTSLRTSWMVRRCFMSKICLFEQGEFADFAIGLSRQTRENAASLMRFCSLTYQFSARNSSKAASDKLSSWRGSGLKHSYYSGRNRVSRLPAALRKRFSIFCVKYKGVWWKNQVRRM